MQITEVTYPSSLSSFVSTLQQGSIAWQGARHTLQKWEPHSFAHVTQYTVVSICFPNTSKIKFIYSIYFQTRHLENTWQTRRKIKFIYSIYSTFETTSGKQTTNWANYAHTRKINMSKLPFSFKRIIVRWHKPKKTKFTLLPPNSDFSLITTDRTTNHPKEIQNQHAKSLYYLQ